MNKLIAVLAIAGALFAAPASAQHGRPCAPIAGVINVVETNPEIERHVVLRGTERERAMAFINAVPPQTNDDFATIILVFMRDGKTGAVLLGDKESICHAYRVTKDAFYQLVETAMGRVS